MPTVLRIGPYRFEFYASDKDEPPHVHVIHGSRKAKFWLGAPVRLQKNQRFPRHELNKVRQLVVANRAILLERWHEYFRDQ
jgi:hypothetical protein